MNIHPRLLPSLAALTDAVSLSQLIGHIDDVRIDPLPGVGYSNASLSYVKVGIGESMRRSFVLKRTRLDQDWTARRTTDGRGREALLLAEPSLGRIWQIFACPYVAFALEPGEIGLLLYDLTSELLPNERKPLLQWQEDALISALARLHASFWNVGLSANDWLVRPAHYCDFLAPSITAAPTALAALSDALRVDVPKGWASALSRLPALAARHLTCPGSDWERVWADLPQTLLHGDAKVANFALLSDGRVAAFDWALVGGGPCTIDLGWYLAVNGSRLVGSKERTISRYRTLLEGELGHALPERVWSRLVSVAIVCGARMLLWSKALALDAARSGADEEWNWWVDQLVSINTNLV